MPLTHSLSDWHITYYATHTIEQRVSMRIDFPLGKRSNGKRYLPPKDIYNTADITSVLNEKDNQEIYLLRPIGKTIQFRIRN